MPESDIRHAVGTAVTPAEGFGSVLLPFLGTLAASAHSYPASVGDRLAGRVADLLITLVAQLTGPPAADPRASNGHLVQRVREHIERHLGDPELSPEAIAREHHISVRYLHRLFEGEDVTVGRLIQQCRLEACARELARRGRSVPTVSAVAQRWGSSTRRTSAGPSAPPTASPHASGAHCGPPKAVPARRAERCLPGLQPCAVEQVTVHHQRHRRPIRD